MEHGYRWMLAIGVVAAGVIGCGGGVGKVPELEPEWLARVPPSQLGFVEEARAERRQRADEAMRAQVAVGDSKKEVGIAESLLDAERARRSAAETELSGAERTGEASRIAQAERKLEVAKLAVEAAEARVELAKAQHEVSSAREELARARVETQEARVRLAEYEALRNTGDVRVRELEPVDFERAIMDRERRELELRERLGEREQRVARASANHESLRSRLHAATGSTPAG